MKKTFQITLRTDDIYQSRFEGLWRADFPEPLKPGDVVAKCWVNLPFLTILCDISYGLNSDGQVRFAISCGADYCGYSAFYFTDRVLSQLIEDRIIQFNQPYLDVIRNYFSKERKEQHV